MKLTLNIALFFGVIFLLGGMITVYLWLKFFPLVKDVDPDLHEKIRFRLKESFNTKAPYARFIFKREFDSHPDKSIKRHARVLHWVGYVSQWTFNICLLLMAVIATTRITIS